MKPIKNWKLRKSILEISAITGAISPVTAEETTNSLDTIIVSGSRSEELLLNTPNAISVIGQEEINRVKFIDARKELLSRIPGNSMGRNLRWAFGSKNYTVNLRDGVSMRAFGKGTNRSINEVNSWDIERVEVIKGPASALYGSHAIGGVINIITKAPPPEREINIWAEAGSWERYRSGISILSCLHTCVTPSPTTEILVVSGTLLTRDLIILETIFLGQWSNLPLLGVMPPSQ